jgi:hypothetical protein
MQYAALMGVRQSAGKSCNDPHDGVDIVSAFKILADSRRQRRAQHLPLAIESPLHFRRVGAVISSDDGAE